MDALEAAPMELTAMLHLAERLGIGPDSARTLQAKRCMLVQPRAADVDTAAKLHADPEATVFLGYIHRPVAVPRAARWLHELAQGEDSAVFAIARGLFSEAVGFAWLEHIEPHGSALASIAITDPKERLLAVDAMFLLGQFAFQRLGLRRLTAMVVDGNDQVLELDRRIGFQVEGRIREQRFADGRWRDVFILGMLARDVTCIPGWSFSG